MYNNCGNILKISHEFSELKQEPGFNLAQSMLSLTNKKIINLPRFTVVDIVVNITYSLLHGTRFAATSICVKYRQSMRTFF